MEIGLYYFRRLLFLGVFPSEHLSNDVLPDYFTKQLRTHEGVPHQARITCHKP